MRGRCEERPVHDLGTAQPADRCPSSGGARCAGRTGTRRGGRRVGALRPELGRRGPPRLSGAGLVSAGLLFVTAAGTRLAVAELDLLTEAAKRGVPVVFVTTGPDPGGPDTTGPETAGPDTAGPDQAGPDEPLVAQAPAFTGSARVRLGADDRAGMAALRRALLDLVASARARTPTASAAPAVTVAALATDERWREILDRETRSRRVSLVQRLVIDLATSHMRCAQEISSGGGCAGLPSALDRELHALSVRLSRALDLAAHDIAGQVFGAVLDAPPSATVLRRIM